MVTTGEEMQERNLLYIALKSTVKGLKRAHVGLFDDDQMEEQGSGWRSGKARNGLPLLARTPMTGRS